MLTYSEKCIRKLQENFACFHDKLHEKDVYDSFMVITNGAKKFAKPEAKVIKRPKPILKCVRLYFNVCTKVKEMTSRLQVLVDELEERLSECHLQRVEDEEAESKATKASRALREKGNRRNTPKKSPKTGEFAVTETDCMRTSFWCLKLNDCVTYV